MPELRIPDWLRFECTSCGLCCRRALHIWCPEKDFRRLAAINWREKYPQVGNQPLFVPSGSNMRFGLKDDGRCCFLDEDNLCIQHRELGYDAKTLTCKMFPFGLQHSEGEVRVNLLFSCPAVVDNVGKPLTEQRHLIGKLLKEQNQLFPPPPATDETALDKTRSISFNHLEILESILDEKFADMETPLVRRILFAANLIDRLEGASDEAVSAEFMPETIAHHAGIAWEAAYNCGLQRPTLSVFERIYHRLLHGMCASLAEPGTGSYWWSVRQRARLARIGIALRYLWGGGLVPDMTTAWTIITGVAPSNRTGATRITFADVDRIRASRLARESEDLLARYLRARFAARTYFGKDGWGMAALPGARIVLAVPGLILWLAKARAAMERRDTVSHEDIRNATLLAEHSFGHMSSLGIGPVGYVLPILNREGWPQKVTLHAYLSGA